MLAQNQDSYGDLLRSEYFLEAVFTWSLKDSFCFRDGKSAVARYRGEVLSSLSNDFGVTAISLDYYADVGKEARWYPVEVNAEDESLEHTVLKTKFRYLEEACRFIDFAVSFSIIDVVNFIAGRVIAVRCP